VRLPLSQKCPKYCFQKALTIAREQKAKSWVLRAATSLARLWQQQGRPEDAYNLLAPVYHGFSEGFDTTDLRAAKGLPNHRVSVPCTVAALSREARPHTDHGCRSSAPMCAMRRKPNSTLRWDQEQPSLLNSCQMCRRNSLACGYLLPGTIRSKGDSVCLMPSRRSASRRPSPEKPLKRNPPLSCAACPDRTSPRHAVLRAAFAGSRWALGRRAGRERGLAANRGRWHAPRALSGVALRKGEREHDFCFTYPPLSPPDGSVCTPYLGICGSPNQSSLLVGCKRPVLACWYTQALGDSARA
jgi:hypothetical protein